MLTELYLQSFRNIATAHLKTLGHINLITGSNGSGKTSLLESIHLLSTGRSFRSTQLLSLIKDTQSELVVSTQLQNGNRLGISRSRTGEFQIKVNQEAQKRLSDIAHILPVRYITPDSFLMLTQGARLRRQYIDFSVFHVEHEFSKDWNDYNKLVKQRNSILKNVTAKNELKHWDVQLIPIAKRILNSRAMVFNQLKDYLIRYQLTFLPQYEVQYRLVSGVQTEDLEAEYDRAFNVDKRYGYTSIGPHKADIKLTIDNQEVHHVLSRGELKMLVISMVLAQVVYHVEQLNKGCCLLIDDLSSELDSDKQDVLLNTLKTIPLIQLFITSIKQPEFFNQQNIIEETDTRLFHVEHGNLNCRN